MLATGMSSAPAPHEPRVAHYLFAHRAVPRAFLQNPAAIMGILGSEDGMRFLDGMWATMDEALEPHQRSDESTVQLECFALEDEVFVAVVTMPTVRRPLEAHFVACAARLGARPFARAFTLDHAGLEDDPDATGILEWNAEGERTLLEQHCRPDASAFVDTIASIVQDGDPPAA